MKKLFFLLAILFVVGCQKKTDQEIIKAISNSLQNLEKVQYNFSFEKKDLQSPSASYSHHGTLAIDFTQQNTLGANVYSKRVKKSKTVFERLAIGDSLINIIDETKTIVKTPKAHPLVMNGNIDLYFNLFDLRRSLSIALQDSTMTNLKLHDTILLNDKAISLTFNIKKYIMGGKLYDTKGINNQYQLVVRKKDYLPILWELKNENEVMTYYNTDLKLSIDEDLWNYNPKQEYTVITGEEYRLREKNNLNKQIGKKFPYWKLSSIRGKEFSNASFKNQLTLYEFFFVGCAGSIASKPFIENIKKTYGNKIKIVNIEIQNFNQKTVRSFVEKHKLSEPVIYKGKNLASKLGVLGCPTYVLVDKSGKIIFSSFGDRTGLTDLIKEELLTL